MGWCYLHRWRYFFVPFSALFGGLFLPFSCEGQTYVVLKPRTSSWSVFCFWPHMGKWYHLVFLCVLFGKDSYEKGGEGIKLLKSALLRISSPAQCDYQTLLISFYGATKVSPLLLEEGSCLVNPEMLKNFHWVCSVHLNCGNKYQGRIKSGFLSLISQ